MKKSLVAIFLTTIAVISTSHAQRMPDYYPERFQGVGVVDAIENGRITINDISLRISSEVVVHSLYQRETFVSRIPEDAIVGYQVDDNREVVEIWILPDNYDVSSARRR